MGRVTESSALFCWVGEWAATGPRKKALLLSLPGLWFVSLFGVTVTMYKTGENTGVIPQVCKAVVSKVCSQVPLGQVCDTHRMLAPAS